MSVINRLYGDSLALLNDLYQLTMACAHHRLGRAEDEAVFNLFYRRNPFEGGYVVACGLAHVVDFIRDFRFDEDDLAYLASVSGSDGEPLFDGDFLAALSSLALTCEIHAVPEGTVVFPNEPLVRVRGPIMQCQLLETPLLNMINFQSLVATKAARICQAARGEPVLEFGLRRAQGFDGGLAASRAAYVGGCSHTSNVLAGKLYGIPVAGTHAHSWVMSFEDEVHAFEAWARAMPNNCVLLADTYDTIEGVGRAIDVGRQLRERGQTLGGVRLDSGDLAYLSIEARRMLDEAGFPEACIVASNDLDESIIESLQQQGARIDVWGVGTRLATAFDQPALGGVYKLTAMSMNGELTPRLKLSEQVAKITTPGVLQVRRFAVNGEFVGDAIHDERIGIEPPLDIIDPLDPTRHKHMPDGAESTDLLEPIMRDGVIVAPEPDIQASRARAASQLASLHPGIRRFVNPHAYPVGLEPRLHELRTHLVLAARGFDEG